MLLNSSPQEGKVIKSSDMLITREFHVIRAHLLHYETLLEDFSESVQFIFNTRNPAQDWYRDGQKEKDRQLLEKESNNLMIEIKRLQSSRGMQDMRVKNVMNLVRPCVQTCLSHDDKNARSSVSLI